jgi:uncharacterized membrane protein
VEHDTAYGLRLLADIAIRGLSPAMNDSAPADRRAAVIERLPVLGRLADAALADPFLREVASHADRQGLGGPNRRGTPSS